MLFNADLPSIIQKLLLRVQKSEITEHHIYSRLAEKTKTENNAAVLRRIAQDEKRHYEFWAKFTGQEVKPARLKIWLYALVARLFGLTFGLKLMERGEDQAQAVYQRLMAEIPEAGAILKDEDEHEARLIDLLDEEKLKYIGSVVLGLNDALVELTGALAGLTLALQDVRLVAMTGLITGLAASFSMAASEYLSVKSDDREGKNPGRAALYTGVAYIFTVLLLISPYLLFTDLYFCLAVTLLLAILIILFFNFYLSVAKNLSFKRRFGEMILLSFSVAGLSFVIGFVVRKLLGVEV